MRAIFLLAWRNLSSRPARTLLSAAGVLLGVALLMAVSVTNRALESALRAQDQGETGAAALVVSGKGQTPNLPTDLAERLSELEGVQGLVPQVRARASIALKGALAQVQVHALHPEAEGPIGTYHMVSGRVPRADEPPGLVLQQKWAAERGLAVGDEVELVLSPTLRVRWPITGLIDHRGVGTLFRGAVVVANLDHYQQAVGHTGETTRLLVLADRAVDLDALTTQVQDIAPGAVSVERGGAESLRSMQEFRMGLTFFAGVSALVGAFLIFGAFSLSLRQRVAETGMVLAVGASRRQVAGALLLEAMGLGMVGSVLGIPVGVTLSLGMMRVVGASSYLPLSELHLVTSDVALSLAVGLGISLLAAIMPALAATRLSPVEAMRRTGPVQAGERSRWAGIGLLLALLGLSGAAFFLRTPAGNLPGQILLGVYFLGVALGTPLLVRWAVYLIQPLARRGGPVLSLAVENLVRANGRVAVTASAMMAAVAMVVSFNAVTASLSRGTEDWAMSIMAGDLQVEGDLNPAVAEAIRSVPGVAAFSPEGSLTLTTEAGWRLAARIIEPAHGLQLLTFPFDEGDRTEAFSSLAKGGGIVLSTQIAEERGLRLGDVITFRRRGSDGRPLTGETVGLRVVGLATIPTAQGRVAFLSRQDALTFFGGATMTKGYLKVAAGTAPGGAVSELRERFPGLEIKDLARFKAELRANLSSDLRAFQAILYIALAVSALGILNTLVMNVVEQRRELALLRAVGATAGQISGQVVVEAVFLGGIGSGLGVLTGSLAAHLVVRTMAVAGKFAAPFAYPTQAALLAVGMGLALAVVASVIPALRAGRVPVVEALRYE